MREPVKYPFIGPAVLTVLMVTLLPPVYSLILGLQVIGPVPPIPGETSLDVRPMRNWN